MTKPQVRKALDRLMEHLQRKGAHVAAVYLPREGGNKIGVDDYLLTHPVEDLEGLVDAPRLQPKAAPPKVELLPHGPNRLTRPLMLIDGRAYVATWLWTKTTITERLGKDGEVIKLTTPGVTEQRQMFVIRDDGILFGAVPDPKVKPLTELGLTVHLPEIPTDNRMWCPRGVKIYMSGQRPDPADVFRRLLTVIDTFLDFSRSLASQEELCELLACYILATYFMDAFTVIGYLWPNGDKGAGKTTLLHVVAELAYLGQVILAGGTYAALRDLADYGATLAFDDAEHVIDLKRGDPDKRALLLTGNRRRSSVPVKEQAADRTWRIRYVNTFCPRLFSAMRLPDDVLASRTITIPLVRSADHNRMNRDPTDYETWPHNRRELIDDLWALALADLATVHKYDAEAAHQAPLSGRPLEPWRAILAVALWLQQAHSVDGLHDRMTALAQAYQRERHDLEAEDPTRLLILALQAMAVDEAHDIVTFSASELTANINEIAMKEELTDENQAFTTPRRVGHLLKRLRLGIAQRSAHKRTWKVRKAEITHIARTYSLTPSAETSSTS
jgi:hypothetical protein